TERVSVDSDGNQATGDRYSPAVADCYNPAISADGRFVAFASLAANLVPGDTNGSMDVFVHDRQTGTTERVSVDSAGTEMSYSDLALQAPPARADPGATERVSVDSAGNQANGPCLSGAFAPPPSITPDGRFVAFAAWARNLAPGDTNGFGDVFVHDRRTSITE